MAEAVGLTASIIAIIQVTASVTSLSYISDFKKAPENIQGLIVGLQSFTAALSTLQVGIRDDTSESSLALQKQLNDPLGKCMIEMKRLEKKLKPKTQGAMGWWKNMIARAR